MNHSELIKSVYNEIGLGVPSFDEYPSIEAFFNDFERWRESASPLVSNYWEYQYPILEPASYWGNLMLKDTGYQFDIVRKRNELGCYATATEVSHIDLPHERLRQAYEALVSEISPIEPPQLTDPLFKKVEELEDRYADVFRYLDGLLRNEDPTNQGDSTEYIFLGSFDWMRRERYLLDGMRRFTGQSVAQKHFKNIQHICDSNSIYITFRNAAFACRYVPSPSEKSFGAMIESTPSKAAI